MRARTSRRATLAVVLAAALTAGCGGSDGSSSAVSATGTSDDALGGAGAGQSASGRVLCSGTPTTISGVVVGTGVPGAGLTIDTGAGSETVYGLGPSWYWSQNGVARPAVGDSVVAVVSLLVTTDQPTILNITVNGQAFTLRDPTTCAPLW